MGHGLGAAQRAILDALKDANLTISGLASATGRSERQVRTAVRGLEARELVVITHASWWKGAGEHGHLVPRGYDHEGPPNAVKVSESDPWPFKPHMWRGGPEVDFVSSGEVELAHQGMPISGQLVWLPERHRAARIARLENALRITEMLGRGLEPAEIAELEELYAARDADSTRWS